MRTYQLFGSGVFVAALCQCSSPSRSVGESHVGQSSAAILSVPRNNLTYSGVFRTLPPGTQTRTALGIPEATFFGQGGTVASMTASGFSLVDIDIDTSQNQKLYAAVFQSGVPSTTYVELAPSDFATRFHANAAQGLGLISLHAFADPTTGAIVYSGVFQPKTAGQIFIGAMTLTDFTNAYGLYKGRGYFVSSLAAYEDGDEYFLGVWEDHPQGTLDSAFYTSEWNAFAKETLTQGAQSKRLVSMAHWDKYIGGLFGDRMYAGQWLQGSDDYDVVAATAKVVFERKITELASVGKVPVRVNIEHGYQPPLGLAAAFNDDLDATAVGYSYGISEEGATTALGGFGYARAPWDGNPDFPEGIALPMNEQTRDDIASVTKLVTGVAMFKLLEDPTIAQTVNLDTPIVSVLGPKLGGLATGQFVDQVTIRELLNMNSGLYEGPCDDPPPFFHTDHEGWLKCVLSQCTRQLPGAMAGPCAPPGNFTSFYQDTDFGVLRSVVEVLANDTFESYVHRAIFVPLGVDVAPSALDLSNANCNPDLSSPNRPLYYASGQTSGVGMEEQGRDRDLTVCGAGGMQLTAAQAITFLSGLVQGTLLQPGDLDTMLGMWFVNKQTTPQGTSYNKNGGYPIANGQGATAAVALVRATNTQVDVAQVAVFANTQADPGKPAVDPAATITDGLIRMGAYPVDTISISNANSSSAWGAMCFNVSGHVSDDNAPIIEWPCGSSPIESNMQFVKLDAGNGQFMLQAVSSGKCIGVLDDGNPNDGMQPNQPIVQSVCHGGPNQLFTLRQNKRTYPGIVVQSTGMCLTVNSNSPRAPIVQATCLSPRWTQQWSLSSLNL